MVTLGAKRVETNPECCSDKFTMITLRTSSETQGQLVDWTIESSGNQWNSAPGIERLSSENPCRLSDFKCKQERNLTV